MFRTAPLLLAMLLSSGCILVADGRDPAPQNDRPTIGFADASCYWDSYYGDYVWWFQVDAYDGDGLGDISGVFVDVYDARRGDWADSFELAYDGGNTWYAEYLERSTWLSCDYYEYFADFVVDDYAGAETVVTQDLW